MEQYANHYGWTDVNPYEIIRHVSDKTIEIREMKAELDPSWKPEILPGGFAGHCVNQNSQKWVIVPDEDAPVIRARLRKDGKWYSKMGKHVLSGNPRKFYDYNF